MKVHVIGGGPAGLYFAILMKKAWPQTRITVFERNRPDDTFGFGVVFSDQTLETFEAYDPRELPRDHRPLRLLGRHRDPFPGHDAPHRRQRLLRLLARDAAEAAAAGARARSASRSSSSPRSIRLEADDPRRRSRGRRRRHQFAHPRDLRRPLQAEHRPAAEQVRLDGLDAAVRRLHLLLPRDRARHLHRALLPVRARPLDLDVRDRSARPSRAPASTALDEAASARIPGGRVRRGAAGPQADHQPLDLAQLPDHPLRALGRTTTSCCSATPRRPRISRSAPAPSSRWRTRSRSTRRSARPAGATSRRRSRTSRPQRREEVEKTQHSADVSLVWFEHVKRFWNMDPTRFAFGLMTRSKAITYDNLALRAPEFVERGRQAGGARRAARRASTSTPQTPRAADVPAVPAARHDARRTASWCRRCASIRRTTACRTTGIWCTTARARSAAPA